jgi:hypothetical protein
MRARILKVIRATLWALEAISPKLAARLAYRLFFLVLRRRPSRTESAALERARRKVIVHDGISVPVYVWGDKGMPCCSSTVGKATERSSLASLPRSRSRRRGCAR